MNNFRQPGHVMTFTAPAGGVSAGDGVKVGQLFVVAASDADAGDEFEGQAVGVFELPRDTGDTAWSEGDIVFWDDSNSQVTDTSAAGLLRIGIAAKDADTAAALAEVRLDGVARADEV